MITHDNVVNFLKQSLTTYFEAPYDNETGEPLGEHSDLVGRMEVFQESSYNSSKDIIITVQFLPGTTQLGFSDLPINVIFEVIEGEATNNKTLANQVMDLINSFIEDYNDTATSMTDNDGNTYVVTQYYSSTTSIGNGQKRGTNNYKAYSMQMRLIVFENGCYKALQDQSIEIWRDGAYRVLTNILAITTNISKPQEGYTKGSNPNQKLRLSGIQYQLQVTYIATAKHSYYYKTTTIEDVNDFYYRRGLGLLYKKVNNEYVQVASDESFHIITYYTREEGNVSLIFATETLDNESYTVTHRGGLATRQATMKIINYTEDTPYADVMKVSITLARG